jgi:protein-disulfide isomerase
MTPKTHTPTLTLPVGPRDHAQGPTSATLTLVEYGDYECPYCGRAYPIVKAVQKRLGAKLRFVFRNFPLAEIHPHAENAALAAEAAGELGKFWEMHDALFENQRSLGQSQLASYAEALGLDAGAFSKQLHSQPLIERVREDFMSGVRSGVNGTPTFFINGHRFDGSWDFAGLVEALEAASRE